MKTLYLLRHAKSSWDDPTVDDHDRRLSPRGGRAARLIATHLVVTGICPDVVLCSSARRARDTLEVLRESLDRDTNVDIEEELYGAGGDELLARIRRVEPAARSVMLIGHNPGLHDLAADLAEDGDEQALAQLHTKFPTAAMAVLQIPTSPWSELDFAQAHLDDLVLPRDLPRSE
jgi:phosphohistidine phosphatase